MREALSFAELSGFDFGREPVFEMSQLLLSLPYLDHNLFIRSRTYGEGMKPPRNGRRFS